MAAASQWTVFALLITLGAASPARNVSRAADASSCTLPGLFCLDCDTLGVCVEIQGKFIYYLMETCTSASPCSHSLKECSDKMSYCTEGSEFECTQAGLFPDPYDCNVYYECGDPPTNDPDVYPATASHTCDIGNAYNPKSGQCDLAESDANCGDDSYPVPKCDGSTFSAGAIDLDPNYYWICQAGVIHVFKCNSGYIFDSDNYRCVYDDDGESTTESTTPSPGAYECSGSEKEPDPSSCTSYYDCADPSNPTHLSCPWGKYFHQRKQKCILGFCPY